MRKQFCGLTPQAQSKQCCGLKHTVLLVLFLEKFRRYGPYHFFAELSLVTEFNVICAPIISLIIVSLQLL